MDADLIEPDRAKEGGDDGRTIINVSVTPNSKKPSVSMIDEENYEVKVDERAEGGHANARLIEILSEYFGVRKSSVSIIRGSRSRDKVVLIQMNSRT